MARTWLSIQIELIDGATGSARPRRSARSGSTARFLPCADLGRPVRANQHAITDVHIGRVFFDGSTTMTPSPGSRSLAGLATRTAGTAGSASWAVRLGGRPGGGRGCSPRSASLPCLRLACGCRATTGIIVPIRFRLPRHGRIRLSAEYDPVSPGRPTAATATDTPGRTSRAGALDVAIPKLRQGPTSPSGSCDANAPTAHSPRWWRPALPRVSTPPDGQARRLARHCLLYT